jgi:hypothetical protein
MVLHLCLAQSSFYPCKADLIPTNVAQRNVIFTRANDSQFCIHYSTHKPAFSSTRAFDFFCFLFFWVQIKVLAGLVFKGICLTHQ